MDKVLEKISAYNIFTNLLPGVVYCFFTDKFFGIPLVQKDLLVAVFFYYFVGMVISRVSSVVVEPLLKASKLVSFVDYPRYVEALSKDEQIGILLEVSNTYRSVIALLVCILATGAWNAAVSKYQFIADYSHYILIGLLVGLFLLAYRKQTQYIVSRINRLQDDGESTS